MDHSSSRGITVLARITIPAGGVLIPDHALPAASSVATSVVHVDAPTVSVPALPLAPDALAIGGVPEIRVLIAAPNTPLRQSYSLPAVAGTATPNSIAFAPIAPAPKHNSVAPDPWRE